MFNEIKNRIFSDKINLYREEVIIRNFKSFDSFAVVGTIISFFVLIYGLTMSKVVTFNTEFSIIFIYFAAMLLISRLFLKKHKKYVTLIFYIALTPLMVMGILMGTFLDKTQPSITIMVFICVLTIFILDKPWRIVLYITSVSIIYTICCYLAKDLKLFVADMIDLIAFYFLAVGVNCFSLSDRISSVENFIKFREKSQIDLLTGIYNRGTGVERTEELIGQEIHGSFIVIDVDNFKNINDNYGHAVGDEVLRKTAEAIKKSFDKDDIIFRLGGDEFAIYALKLENRCQCEMCFEDLFDKIRKIKISCLKDKAFTISLGCFQFQNNCRDFEHLYRMSDRCLYKAKKHGKGCYYIDENFN